jgi:hypothetical protein
MGVFWAEAMVMSWSSACPRVGGKASPVRSGDGDGGGDGDGIGCSLVFGPVLIDVGRCTLRRDMKMDGEGMLLIGLVSRSPVLFAGVGGWGAGLPDSSSDGSPATWAHVLFFLFFLFTSGMLTTSFCGVGKGSWSGSCGSSWGWGDFIVGVRCGGWLVFVLVLFIW